MEGVATGFSRKMFSACFALLLTVQGSLGQGPLGGFLLRMYAQNGLPYREEQFISNLPMNDRYDFIIVGAGPAGSVVANRLSERAEWKILLLEAGMEGNIYTDIPAMSPVFFFTNYNWKYKSEPQEENCRGSVGGVCSWPSGKGVGGATIWNGLIWTRSPAEDYDEWAALGNTGWSYKELLPYFLKVEQMTIPSMMTSPWHSTKGRVSIEYPYTTNLLQRFLSAGKEMGYDEVDYNDPQTPIGFSKTQTTSSRGKRVNAATAYLFPAKNRPNLHIVKNAFVTKILVDPITKEAFGVEFSKNNKIRRILAKKEVILSGGAFNSPLLLLLSGIGPEEHLKSKNISVIHHSPQVGQNLQEHVSGFQTVHINASESLTAKKLVPMLMPAVYEWLTSGKGLLSDNIAEGLGYIKTDSTRSRPDIELIFSPLTMAADDGVLVSRYFGISEELYAGAFKDVSQKEGFTVGTMGMYPESRGSISLRSNNPMDPPVIVTNFLTDDRDVKTIIGGLKFVEKLVETQAMKEIGASLYKKQLPGCENYAFGTDSYYKCAITMATGQLHHQCCTDAMGPDPETSVVNPRLLVHGVKRLRIADASVMPRIPGGHTMAVSYAIGEKASDLIKEDWGSL